jgi:hypothetical protein
MRKNRFPAGVTLKDDEIVTEKGTESGARM